MTSRTVAQLLSDLGVDRGHSRPRISNDNPFSEAQFKTLKYRPDFPNWFNFDDIEVVEEAWHRHPPRWSVLPGGPWRRSPNGVGEGPAGRGRLLAMHPRLPRCGRFASLRIG